MSLTALATFAGGATGNSAAAGSAQRVAGHGLAARAGAAIADRIDALPGTGPVLLRSYDGESGQGPPPEPALAGAAFSYDNALAAIALVACGRIAPARRLGEALRNATDHDRTGTPGRLRNAYRAGPQAERPVPPTGWWDRAANAWREDAHQVGIATGNVAWTALALLTLADATGDTTLRDAAGRLAGWIAANTLDARAPAGFAGGLHGADAAPHRLGWKSTEHNADCAAVFDWLARTGPPGDWARHAALARSFLAAMWDDRAGRFLIGTLPDGTTPNRAGSGLDAQLWPLLLRDAPDQWRRSLGWVERVHGVAGGFDFNDDRDGVWVEGTAQAALAYRVDGRHEAGARQARRLLAGLAGDFSPGGLSWATRGGRLTTGLALGPDSAADDFFYERRPHLGATAWIALAALGWNPFIGRLLPAAAPAG